jgi:uncharacterized phage infection (PIP) family protein YhgE
VNTVIFSIIAAAISLGGVFIAIGVFKSRINQNSESNKAQDEHIKSLASKSELAAAVIRGDEQLKGSISRGDEKLAAAMSKSDELLKVIMERTEEDRKSGEGKFHDFYGLLSGHGERIRALETQQSMINENLKEIKGDVKEGFRKIEDSIRELVKAQNGVR